MDTNNNNNIEEMKNEYAGIRGVEGKDFAYVHITSTTELGRMLSPIYNSKFHTCLGQCNCVMTFVGAMTIEDYDLSLLQDERISREKLRVNYQKNKVMIPNYWGVVAYAITSKIMQSNRLLAMLKDNHLPLVNKPVLPPIKFKHTNYIGAKYVLFDMKYLSIVNMFKQSLLAKDNYTTEDVVNFVKSFLRKDTRLFDNVACFDKLTTNEYMQIEPNVEDGDNLKNVEYHGGFHKFNNDQSEQEPLDMSTTELHSEDVEEKLEA